MIPLLRAFLPKPKSVVDERFGIGAARRVAVAIDEEVSRHCSYRGPLTIFLFDVVPPDGRSGSLVIDSFASGDSADELPSPEAAHQELLDATFHRVAIELGYSGRLAIGFKDRVQANGYPFSLKGCIARSVRTGTLSFTRIDGSIEEDCDDGVAVSSEAFDSEELSRLERYSIDFDAARDKALRLGLSVPPADTRREGVLGRGDTDIAREIIEAVQRQYSLEWMVGGCLHVSYFMRDIVEQIAGMRAFLTVGAVTFLEKEMFRFTDEQMENWLQRGIPQGVEDLHAWLTLESMEIVDLTYFVTLATVVPNLGVEPMPILASPAVLVGVQHTPLVVADDIVSRLGAVRYFRS